MTQVIKLSDNAANRIKEIMSSADNLTIGVRVGVKSGGCAGMSYIMEYAKEIKPNEEIIEDKDRTYSPLALYFIIDNNIVNSNDEINQLFDEVLNINKLDKEIKNLVIYKKGLFNSEFENENNLIKILNPILNSNSIWKSHALFLMGEYFLDKNEKQKAKEFFEKILILENTNSRIKLETQKIIQRDLSE